MTVHTEVPHSSGQVLSFRGSLLAMLGVSFVTMLVALDQTVVGTALPTIVADLHGFDLYAWVATSYLLTSVITVPIFGRLGDYFGRKPFLLASVVIFTAASVLCGAAHSMLFLVVARALQGIGGGMLVGTAFACIPDLFPDPRVRLRWQVLMSTAFGIANAIGPSLGGILTQYWGWRSVFYVNLPVGVVSLFFLLKFLPHLRQTAAGAMRLDWPGAVLIALSLGSLQLFVESFTGGGAGFGAVALVVVCLASSYGLWQWEKRAAQPILPIEMFRNPHLAPLFVLAVLGGFSMFALLFYAPLLFQGGFGLSPQAAGLLITPLVVCITVGSIVNGRIVTRVKNPNAMLLVGFALITLCCVGMIVSSRRMPHGVLVAVMLVGGLGLGFVMPNLTVFAQQSAGRAHLGIATALLQSLRMVGGMLGTALTGTLVNHLYASRVAQVLGASHAQGWAKRFTDPHILISETDQLTVGAEMARSGIDAAALMEGVRLALVSAIHFGMILAAVAAALGYWQSRRVPPVRIDGPLEPVVAAE